MELCCNICCGLLISALAYYYYFSTIHQHSTLPLPPPTPQDDDDDDDDDDDNGQINHSPTYILAAIVVIIIAGLAAGVDESLAQWLHSRNTRHRHCTRLAHCHPSALPYVHPSTAPPPLVLARPAGLLLDIAAAEDSRFITDTEFNARTTHDWPEILFSHQSFTDEDLLPGYHSPPPAYLHHHPLPTTLLAGSIPKELERWGEKADRTARLLRERDLFLDTIRHGYKGLVQLAPRPERCFSSLGMAHNPVGCAAVRWTYAPAYTAAVRRAVSARSKQLKELRTSLSDLESFCRTSIAGLDGYRSNITAHIYRYTVETQSPIPSDYVQALRTRYLASTIATAYLQAHHHLITTQSMPFLDEHISSLAGFSRRIFTDELIALESPLRMLLESFAADMAQNLTSSVLVPDRPANNALRAQLLYAFWSGVPSVPSPAAASWLKMGPANALRCASWKAWYLDAYDMDEAWKSKLSPSMTWEDVEDHVAQGTHKDWSLNDVLGQRLIDP